MTRPPSPPSAICWQGNEGVAGRERSITSSIARAGAAYFAVVFLAGFLLGTVRTLWLTPKIGPLMAVAAELPVMLAIAWLASAPIMRRFGIEVRSDKLAAGLVAFLLLMMAEFLLAAAFGVEPASYAASWLTAPGALGLAGQVLFALIPVLRKERLAQ